MDGDWITTMRTGAVAAHTVQLLAKPGARKIAIAGLGNTAAASLLCIAESQQEKQFEIGLLKYKDQHLRFQERFSSFPHLSFQCFGDMHEMAEWCDVMLSCITVTDKDLVSPEAFGPGALVVPVHTRGFAQCDLTFDKVFCDDIAHVSNFKFFSNFEKKLAEVSAVLSGDAAGREHDEERIIAYNIGIALHDMLFASRIEEMTRKQAVSTIALDKPTTKFWV